MSRFRRYQKYFCEIRIFLKSCTEELEFRRTCKTKKAATELAAWIHKQYAEGASSEVLTLEMPCQIRGQAPRTLSFRTRDVCAITTAIDIYDDDVDEEDFKIEPGFRDTAQEAYLPLTVGGCREDELVAEG